MLTSLVLEGFLLDVVCLFACLFLYGIIQVLFLPSQFNMTAEEFYLNLPGKLENEVSCTQQRICECLGSKVNGKFNTGSIKV